MKIESNLKTSKISPTLRQDWPFILSWILSGFFLFCGILKHFFDYDIYHMLAAGKAISQYGILKEDIFFVDSGHKLIIQQWLYDIVVYFIYDNFGKIGILIFTLILTALFILLAVRIIRFYDVDIRLAVTAVLLICIHSVDVMTVRPGLLTMVLLLAQLYLCEKHRKTGKSIFLFLIPLLTLLEINFHASMWIAHYIFFLPYLVPIPSFINKHIKLEDNHISIKKLIMPIVLMTVSLFINPYGLDGITILFKQNDINRLGITELQSPTLFSKFGIVLIVLLIITAFLYGKTKIHSSNAFMFFGTSLMMILNLRNIQMFSIGVIAIACDLLCFIPIEKLMNVLRKSRNLIILLCTVLTCVLIGISLINNPLDSYFRDEPSDKELTPVLAVEYLNEHATHDARIYTDFNSGSYISWNGYKIYFSSRTEGYCKESNGGYDLVGEYLMIANNLDTDFTETYDQYETVVYGNGYVVFKAK